MISFERATQVLTPPEPGLLYLRSDRAGELRLDPGELTVDGGQIAALEATGDAEVRVDASGCALLPGFLDCHTHLPFAGWRGSFYGDLHATGRDGVEFFTEKKVVTSRWT